jgi:rhamnulokinase
VPSLFNYYLGAPPVVDSTWASVSQLMDARQMQWSAELLKKLSIPADILPPIVPPGTVAGELSPMLAERLGFARRPRLIAVASHDTASAFAAAPAENPAEALIISSGTWSLVGMLIPKPITTAEAMAANVSNEGGIGNIRFLRNCVGTWIVQELRRVWREADGREMTWEEISEIAAAAPAFAAFIDPDDAGFYNPPNMEKALLEFCARTGQAAPTDRGTLVRVVYESLALKYRVVSEVIARISGAKICAVHVVGGGCRNAMLNQFTADSLGVPLYAGPEEATAVGNIAVQALGLGIVRCVSDGLRLIGQSFKVKPFAPQNSPGWDAAYRKFRTFVK